MKIYRAEFPATGELMESPNFKTLYRGALYNSRINKLDCHIYAVHGEITETRADGSFSWKTDSSTCVLLYDLTYLAELDCIMVWRIMSWRSGLRALMMINARTEKERG